MTDASKSPWWNQGHLSEAALSALADGQLGEPELLQHAETCETCAGYLADEALASLRVGDALSSLALVASASMQPVAASEPALASQAAARFKLPVGAVGAALALGVLSSLPLLPEVTSLPRTLAGLRIVWSGLAQQFSFAAGEAGGTLWSIGLTIVFGLSGVFVARWGSRRDAAQKQGGSKHGFA